MICRDVEPGSHYHCTLPTGHRGDHIATWRNEDFDNLCCPEPDHIEQFIRDNEIDPLSRWVNFLGPTLRHPPIQIKPDRRTKLAERLP